MDYFRILNLNREPFSNSPEPEFFFPSLEHTGCLQELELAVRLRRGLNVVIGDVGTGKTTLCRQLLLKFAASEKDGERIEAHLLMDPAFTNPREFLSVVAMTFGVAGSDSLDSEWQLRESIKNYLFKSAVDDERTVVLLIDEGQKLPDFCLELLREFLNYETNEYKILQIVIFAQREFEQTLKRMMNVADRVNLYYFLNPLNFRETRGMVISRLAKAGDTDKAPSLFTYPGLWALYMATGGYPRKIVTLCHQIILALIIQNRSRAGWFLVRSCARRGRSFLEQRRNVKWIAATVLTALCVFVIVAGLYPSKIFDYGKEKKHTILINVRNPSPVINSASEMVGMGTTSVTEAVAEEVSAGLPAVPKTMPDLLGGVRLKKDRTVWRTAADFYGDLSFEQFQAVVLANQHLKDLNQVRAGEVIKLPALPAKSKHLSPGKYWVQVASGENIEEIYELYKSYERALPSLMFLPYWNFREGLVFSIFLKDGYVNRESALGAVRNLPSPLTLHAKIISKPDDDTVFFKNQRR
ncbi:MAG: AAA family ATPase [Syntrophales bacterium]